MAKKRFYITTPIYYVNDKPHIGHAYTTIAADVLARWHRLEGDEVFFLTGTDEHGAKVAQSAEELKKTPQQLCDENSKKFKQAFKNLNIDYSYFIRTTDQRHKEAVAKFMQKLWKNGEGDIYEGTYEGLYCTGCENFLTEKELIDGKCPNHLKAPEKIKEKNYFFKLEKYLPQVRELIEKDEIKIRPEDKKKETLGLFKQGLEDFSLSRERVKWGIPLPFDQSQVTYVWVEALQNYISAIGYGDNQKEFEKWWVETGPLHLMAKDILKFHCVYWPALLLAAGEKPPKEIFVHGFFTINGQKMSKSLGNVIDPEELVKKYGADATRYLLLAQFPFGQDGDIKAEKFDEQFNADLANGLGNLVSRVLNLVVKYNESKVPERDDSTFFVDKTGMMTISVKNGIVGGLSGTTAGGVWYMLDKLINRFDFSAAIDIIMQRVIKPCNQVIDNSKPWETWKTDKASWEKLMYTLLEVIRHMGWMIRPFMPNTSDEIFKQLGIPKEGQKILNAETMKWGGLPPGTKIKKGKILFPRM